MIDIVLASFNGERFIAEQITSIQQCIGYEKFISRLIIVDDGSTDNTLDVVNHLAAHDDKIELIINTSNLHGVSHNFSFGLSKTTAEYIMLSDQDDVWLPEKIDVLYKEMEGNQKGENNKPVLIFSDKLIVDESLQVMCDSYFSLKNIPKTWHLEFKQLCQQNVVSGCTVLFNRALLKQALPIPDNAYMHDWWLAMVASRCGELVLIEQPLIKYRQHATNTIGAVKRKNFTLLFNGHSYYNNFKKSFNAVLDQAIAFQRFEKKNQLPPDSTINMLANLRASNNYQKLGCFFDGEVTRSHFWGRVALFILLLNLTHSHK